LCADPGGAVLGGRLAEPFVLRFTELASQPRSAERILRDYLEGIAKHGQEKFLIPGSPEFEMTGRGDLGEHLWLVARWYYSNPREGEIFFREKDWPYRRILRACSRLLAPKTSEAKTGDTQGPAPASEGAS